jgi:hypothetical protein
MSSITASQSANQISPANERAYHQSNLLGEWKGFGTNHHEAVGFKVVNIRGNTAQVEYTHNGRTERGIASVEGGTISFDNVTIGTRNGTTAILEFSAGDGKSTAALEKAVDPDNEQNKLIGTWGGVSPETGQSATFRVLSVDGRDAKVRTTLNGYTQDGVGTVYKNTVMFGNMQVSSDDGANGKIIFSAGRQTLAVPVTKYAAVGSTSSVDQVA